MSIPFLKPSSPMRSCTAAAVKALFLFSICFNAAQARNSFLVAPGRVDIDLSRPKTESFIITNNGDEKIRLSIEPVYFAVNSKSLAAGEPLGHYEEGHDDLHESVLVSPRTLSLEPGQRRDIRISVRSSKKLAEGDYRAHMLVRMAEIATTIEPDGTADSSSMGMKLKIKMETGVAIYGRMGERNPHIDFVCEVDGSSGQLVVLAKNTSPWLFDGQVEVFPKGKVAAGQPLSSYRLRSIRESVATKLTDWKYDRSLPELDIRWADPKNESIDHVSSCSVRI